ncbi:negative elongation factor E-like protein [Sarcoptes scabiei]|uniref:Negative elongation factor E n=1 Tax=Sarcoptes scabiei TaxID=52283 RepID=A0A132A138_SARSC|nr:negative elongation factor E-like protein [Sarcoptes scabiei]
MTFVQLPSKLTEEELALKRKYQKLKRKKKLLQQLKTPKQEQPVVQPIKRAPENGTDAKEVAKKLLKSGKIQAIKVPDKKERQESGFKRSKAHERKRCTGTDKPGGYQPFNQSYSNDDGSESESIKSEKMLENNPKLREIHSAAREEAFREKKRDGKANYVNRDDPQQGNTIYVHGENITEEILRLGFSTFGSILNINAETARNCGFVTYDSIETANMAIDEMNGKLLNGIRLKVSLARRQPSSLHSVTIEKPKSADLSNESLSTSEAWSAMASNVSNNVENSKNRNMISYEDDDDIYSEL